MAGQSVRSPAKRPARMAGQARREHFLDVTAEIIKQHGVDAVTMEAVAAAAGVSKGLGYAYFTNRGDLLLALLDREFEDFNQRILDAIRAGHTFEERVRGAVVAWFDVLVERGGLLGTLVQAGPVQETLQARRLAAYRQLEVFWGRMAAQEFGVPEDKAVAASAILIAGMQGVLERWTEAGDARSMLEDTYVELTVGGIRSLRRPSAKNGHTRG